ATEWHVQHTINPDDSIVGQHIKLYAMDSAVLHARALLEFLTSYTVRNHLGVDLFGVERITSDRYPGDWKDPMNRYLMHANDRPGRQQLTSFDGTETKHLKRMPVDFGREVVKLWREFIRRLGDQNNPLAASAQTVLDNANAESALVVTNEANSA